MIMHGKLFIISAPSGAGKTSLVSEVIKRLSSNISIERVITYTTKQPRQSEVVNKDYYFITVEEFKKKIKQNFFIEWSTNYGHYYGSPRHVLNQLEKGISLIFILDRTGAQQMNVQLSNVVLIWIYTKNLMILQKRLSDRATESIEQMNYRLAIAVKELEEEACERLYQYHILNDSFDSALQKLESIILNLFPQNSN